MDVGRSSSYTFLFWDNYTKLSQLLLDYVAVKVDGNKHLEVKAFADMIQHVAAKVDGNKHLEVKAFAEMIPYDFMCGN